MGSHPTWVRGLKLGATVDEIIDVMSHPTWVRGLKQDLKAKVSQMEQVAPYVGAWIETNHPSYKSVP